MGLHLCPIEPDDWSNGPDYEEGNCPDCEGTGEIIKDDDLEHTCPGCMAKAHDDEMTFVLLGRDAAAPVAIRAWIAERIRIGKNRPDDDQIIEAEQCAQIMDFERVNRREAP